MVTKETVQQCTLNSMIYLLTVMKSASLNVPKLISLPIIVTMSKFIFHVGKAKFVCSVFAGV